MRMVVISLIILLLFIGVWAWFYFTSVDPVTDYYWDSLGKLSDLVKNEDWDNAKANIQVHTNK